MNEKTGMPSRTMPRAQDAPLNARPSRGNLWSALPAPGGAEEIRILLAQPGVRVERIVSHGQASAPGFWYDQDEDEFVLLVSGSATLTLRGPGDEAQTIHLAPGDWLHLPAHCRHRVDATDPDEPTLWLAIFYPPAT